MLKFPRSQAFPAAILKWYRLHARDLPWRRTKDPYKIWISEIMLQQTTVKAVIAYYERWISRFPTIRSLAQSDMADVLKAWQGLGYYNRAKNLHRTAQIVCAQHKGRLPQDPVLLRALPGFGPYTVGSVSSIAFNKPVAIVDANVRRVFQRLLSVQDLTPGFDKELYALLEKVVPQKDPGDFNQGLMELGALICRSKEPACNICPVKGFCQAYRNGIQELIPRPKNVQVKAVQAVVAIIRQKGRILIQKRSSQGLLADLWEFPGGKIEQEDKDLVSALRRELREELGLAAEIGRKLGQVRHYYTQFKVDLHVYEAEISGQPQAAGPFIWASIKDLKNKYPMPSGSARIVETLLSDV